MVAVLDAAACCCLLLLAAACCCCGVLGGRGTHPHPRLGQRENLLQNFTNKNLGPSRASALGAQFDRNMTEIWFNLTWERRDKGTGGAEVAVPRSAIITSRHAEHGWRGANRFSITTVAGSSSGGESRWEWRRADDANVAVYSWQGGTSSRSRRGGGWECWGSAVQGRVGCKYSPPSASPPPTHSATTQPFR